MQTRTYSLVITLFVSVGILGWLLAAPMIAAREPDTQATQPAEVFAEAIGQANLRSGPGLEYALVGEITAGVRYRVLSQHALVPWLRLDYAGAAPAEAWVYVDLVTVIGNLALVPEISDFASPDVVPFTPPPTQSTDPVSTAASNTPVPTFTATPAGPTVTTLGKTNVRFGPGVEYPTIIELAGGVRLQVLERHALVPWVRVALPNGPQPSGWVYNELVEVIDDLSQVPVTSATHFNVPELTPTPQTVIVGGAPSDQAPVASGTLASTLGQDIHSYLMEQGFQPYTDRLASVFVLDLQTGDRFTLYGDVAFSGMSLTKIPILVTYFQRHTTPLVFEEAYLIADTMMCSENITTNDLLAQIGNGDPLTGAQRVTALMQTLDLRGTFILRQYVTQEGEMPTGLGTIQTGADQSSARPDQYNQVVPEDLGWLLASIYQCAQNETGLLLERYPNDFTAQECRLMLRAMDANEIGVFTEAGVPPGTRVVHKHGWIDDTHGDAAIVFGPEGAYVFVAVLYGEGWLEFEQSSPVIAELSRMTWNYFFPEAPVEAIHSETVPADCDPLNDPVVDDLLNNNLPVPGP